MSEWRAYFPDDGETSEHARKITHYDWQRIIDADDAADYACEMDFNSRDGWERMEQSFPIVVIAPDGTEHKYTGRHEPSVDHITEPTP